MDHAGTVCTGSATIQRTSRRAVRNWLVLSLLVCFVVIMCSGAAVSWDGSAWLVLVNRLQYIAQPLGPDQTAVQIVDVSSMEHTSAIALVRAVAGDLRVEPSPELKAVIISGLYAQVNSAKTALDGYLR